MMNETLRELNANELDNVSGGGMAGAGAGVGAVGQGMGGIFGDWDDEPAPSTGMPLCGGAVKVQACLLP